MTNDTPNELAHQIVSMIETVLETADLTPEERAEYLAQKADLASVIEEKVVELLNEDEGPLTLGEAVTTFQERAEAIKASGTVTDLARDQMNKAARDIVEIAADGPDANCLTCRGVRAAGRAAVVLSELGEHILVDHEGEEGFDSRALETGIATLNTEIITWIVDVVEAHRGDH